VHGRFPGEVIVEGDSITIKAHGKTWGPIKVTAERDPTKLKWDGVDIAAECTGIFTAREKAQVLLGTGARKVLISAPGENSDKTIVYGVNHETLTAEDKIVSNASCTTNCLAPVAKILHEKFGILRGYMVTIHAYTGDQNTVDTLHKDLHRARAAAVSAIPTSTGAAKAVGVVIPELNKKLTGMSFRVPTSDVSVVDLTAELNSPATMEEIKAEIKAQSEGALKGILGYTEDKVVATDFRGDTRTSIFDADAGLALDSTFVKLVSWYDNEWGYSNKCLEMVRVVAGK